MVNEGENKHFHNECFGCDDGGEMVKPADENTRSISNGEFRHGQGVNRRVALPMTRSRVSAFRNLSLVHLFLLFFS